MQCSHFQASVIIVVVFCAGFLHSAALSTVSGTTSNTATGLSPIVRQGRKLQFLPFGGVFGAKGASPISVTPSWSPVQGGTSSSWGFGSTAVDNPPAAPGSPDSSADTPPAQPIAPVPTAGQEPSSSPANKGQTAPTSADGQSQLGSPAGTTTSSSSKGNAPPPKTVDLPPGLMPRAQPIRPPIGQPGDSKDPAPVPPVLRAAASPAPAAWALPSSLTIHQHIPVTNRPAPAASDKDKVPSLAESASSLAEAGLLAVASSKGLAAQSSQAGATGSHAGSGSKAPQGAAASSSTNSNSSNRQAGVSSSPAPAKDAAGANNRVQAVTPGAGQPSGRKSPRRALLH